MNYQDLHHQHLDDWEARTENARSILELLPFESVGSAVDVGCGVGGMVSALSSFYELESHNLFGLDGDTSLVRSPEVGTFRNHDLERPIDLGRRFDLVFSLEVAEHLSTSRAESFVRDLTTLGDCIIFSAAMPLQGGVGHINEQKASYWVSLFEANGFVCFDELRFRLPGTAYSWFRQNLLLFVRDQSDAFFEAGRRFGGPTFKGDYYAAEIVDRRLQNSQIFQATVGQCVRQGRSTLKAGKHNIVLSLDT